MIIMHGTAKSVLLFWATTVVVEVSGGRHGATHDLAQRGVSRSGWESVMVVDPFCRNAVGPPEWKCEAMGSVDWVQCTTSAECIINLSTAASSVMGMGSY